MMKNCLADIEENKRLLQPSIKNREPVNSTWIANLSLEFAFSAHGSQLTKTKRSGPLSVQKAFYPEGRDCAHVYLLHPPAGIVSGDQLHIDIRVKPQAHCLVTTPGANRFYRAREDRDIGDSKQIQVTNIAVEKEAKCENFPLETIVYEGADGFNTVDIHLTDSSCYLGWDITSLGLPSSGERFNLGRYTQLNRIYCNGSLIFHDRIAINPENKLQNHIAGLNNCNVFATFIAYKATIPNKASILEILRTDIDDKEAAEKLSVTCIRDLIIIRYLGEQAEECKILFTSLWQLLRPIYLDKKGIMPRIWHT